MSKALVEIITESIKRANSYSVDEIFYKFNDIVTERYSGKNLDYQLRRMGIESTGDIKRTITEYLANSKNAIPDIEYGVNDHGSKKRRAPSNFK